MPDPSEPQGNKPVKAVKLDSGEGLTAIFVPEAGMIGVSLMRDGNEMLGQRGGLENYIEKGKTMGLPILFPWANRLNGPGYNFAGKEVKVEDSMTGIRRDANGLPIHGSLAAFPGWSVVEAASDSGLEAASLRATLDFGAHPELLASFPFPHRLDLDFTLRDTTLTVTTTVTATGDLPVPLAYGFHPYLALPGIDRSEWKVELPAMDSLELDGRGIPTGRSSAAKARKFKLEGLSLDDGFAGLKTGAAFRVSGGDHKATVRFESGYPAAQVFAPAGEQVICFEPMKAPSNALVSGDGLDSIEPGGSDTSVFSITIA